jgi:outer membrane protein assembly factor BamB
MSVKPRSGDLADARSMDRRTFLSAAAGAGAAWSALAVATAHPKRAEPPGTPVAQFYAGPDADIPGVGLRWAFSAAVFFADRIMIPSPTPRGYTSVAGGKVWGPRLQGRVLPHSGADYFKTTFSTYYLFQASDGELIFIHNRGTFRRFKAPPESGHPLEPALDPRAPGWLRFRATPVFTAPRGPHDWMNRTVFVANCERHEHPDRTVFTYYEVL